MPKSRIRVVIADPTRFLRDALYEAIQEQTDFKVVGEVADESATASVVDRLRPDCLVVPLESSDSPVPLCCHVLESHPTLKIVAIGKGTDLLGIYWKCKEGHVRYTYGTVSRNGILRALRFSISS